MARVRIPLVVLGPDGRPLAGATAAVRRRSDGAAVNVYAAETGGTTLTPPQVISDDGGRVAGWTDRGSLEATITGPSGSTLAPYIVAWEALPAADAAGEAPWLPDGIITARMVGAAAIAYDDLAADVLSALVPIGGLIPYAGDGDPAGGRFLLADGRLLDRATPAGAAIFTVAGHAYNGGVDPGSNRVRIPDKRGRVSVGADNMGTTQGAAGRLPNSVRAKGQGGGEERHALTAGETPSVHVGDWRADVAAAAPGTGALDQRGSRPGNERYTPGPGTAHNVLQPYEVDNYLVRVL